MKKLLLSCVAFSLLVTTLVAAAAPSKVRTPTPNPLVGSTATEKDPAAKVIANSILPLKIDAVTFVSSWTQCLAMPGFAPGPDGSLEATDAHSVGFCGMASVRLKKTSSAAKVAGRNVTIQVSSQHFNLKPWSTAVSFYTLPFPASGDTLTYPRVAVSSFPGDNPASASTNTEREMDADRAFQNGRTVLVELKNDGQTIDKRACTFKTFPSPSGLGSAQLTCP
jgi:hypothetical protein